MKGVNRLLNAGWNADWDSILATAAGARVARRSPEGSSSWLPSVVGRPFWRAARAAPRTSRGAEVLPTLHKTVSKSSWPGANQRDTALQYVIRR